MIAMIGTLIALLLPAVQSSSMPLEIHMLPGPVSAELTGLSKTVFLGEHSQAVSQKAWAGVVAGGFCQPTETYRLLAHATPAHAAAFVLSHSGPAADEQSVIHAPNDSMGHPDQMFSEHPTGANVTLGDGSMRLIDAAIDHQV